MCLQTRLVSPSPNEQNYHIFYQMLAGLTPEERSEREGGREGEREGEGGRRGRKKRERECMNNFILLERLGGGG